jgi:integrase/recombinase XerD
MRTPKVRLYVRIRVSDGRYRFVSPVRNRNGSLRAGFALVTGRQELHPEGVYYLRFLRDGKRIWQPVGLDSDAALAAFQNTEQDLRDVALGRTTQSISTTPSSGEPSVPSSLALLAPAVEIYIERLRKLGRSFKTVREANRILDVFAGQFPTKVISEITSEDLITHMGFLRGKHLSERSISNHIIRITALLRRHKIVDVLGPEERPQYEEPEVQSYNADELMALLAAAGDEERLLYEFFLSTGLREQEVMHCSWSNIDFKNKLVKVRSKPAAGFQIKDKQERSVPVPDTLIDSLKERRLHSTSTLVFPGPGGKANGHFLRQLKGLALRAGMNCGECVGKPSRAKSGKLKPGLCCAAHPTCKDWGLHKFRKTFATMHAEAGVPVTTIQRWLGHSDLATTLRYVAISDLRSERTRAQVNATFASFRPGSEFPSSTHTLGPEKEPESASSVPLQTPPSKSQKTSQYCGHPRIHRYSLLSR